MIQKNPIDKKDHKLNKDQVEVATLAGGCFWCIEAVFAMVQGIKSVVSGYSGGHVANPTYEQVCSETTGHAEAVQLEFQVQDISYHTILNMFFSIHDPTTLNRQGNDIGESYRSAIFYHNQSQLIVAKNTIESLETNRIWGSPIVTELKPVGKFYLAEDYHQQYYTNNQSQPYCEYVVSPKISKFRSQYSKYLRD